MTEFVVRASSLKSEKWHSVETKRSIVLLFCFVVFFVISRNGRSVNTGRYFLIKMLVRGSSPAGLNFSKNPQKIEKKSV